jgi:hypothetical protein
MAGASIIEFEPLNQFQSLPIFDEIVKTFLVASDRVEHTLLQNHLGHGISICGVRVSRRAVVLVVHEMKEDVEEGQCAAGRLNIKRSGASGNLNLS